MPIGGHDSRLHPPDVSAVLPSRLAYVYAKGSMWSATRKANRILTVSEASKHDILRFFDVAPEKVSVIYNAIDERFPAPAESGADGTGAAALSARAPVHPVCGQHQAAQEPRRAFDAFGRMCSGAPEDLP